MSEFKLNSTLISLKNIKRKCQNQTAKHLNARKNRSNDKQMLANPSDNRNSKMIPPTTEASCPSFADLENERVDGQNSNEFYALREQLINKK